MHANDATISLVADSQGNKPKRNSIHVNKPLSDGLVLSFMVHK